MAERIELKEENLEEVIGGAFNWYDDKNTGAERCYVDDVGDFGTTPAAFDRLVNLKIQHKFDGWTPQDYVNALVNEGLFF